MHRRMLLCLPLCLLLSCDRKAPRPAVLGTLPEFSLRSQEGKPFGTADLRGKIWVAAFMFTRCPTVCPRITARMKGLQQEAKAQKLPLHFVTFSVDPEHDTPEVLAKYAQDNGIDASGWSLLTGELDAIKKTSVDGFKMALEGTPDATADHLGMLHGSHLVLVDDALGIVGYYRSSDEAELKKLLADAESLGKR